MRHLLILLALTTPVDGPAPKLDTAVGTGTRGDSGDGGPADKAGLNQPFDVAFDGSGNLYLSDTFNHRVRRVDARTRVITTVAGNGHKGFSGDDGPATQARLDEPYGIVLDKAGDLYIADRLNRRVRKVGARTGLITTVAGDGSIGSAGDDGPASMAQLVEPNGVAIDPTGRRLYIADVASHRVRVIDLTSGTITTFAGTGQPRHSGDGGPANAAGVHGARAVEVGPDGTVYVLEREGNTLRAVDLKTGLIKVVAGTGAKGHAGDGGPALAATFNSPKELAVDRRGNLLIVDTENHAIRRIDFKTGVISTLVGGKGRLARPHGVAVGPDGSVFVGDTENHRVARYGK